MKTQFAIALAVMLLCVANAFYTPQQPLQLIRSAYLADMEVFEKHVKNLKKVAESTPLSIEALQKAFKEARLAYKKVAWLIGYLEPDNEKNFNGPPLTKVENIGFTEIDPLGFQPIEEIVFGDEVTSELDKLRHLVNELLFFTQRWGAQMTNQPLSDREVFEAFRSELIHIFALSLTGFDSPVAFHSIPEAAVAWSNVVFNFNFYKKNLEKKDVALSRQITKVSQEGQVYLLKNQDFDTFDRLFFYKNYLNPLYAYIVKAQKTLGVEYYALTGDVARAWNDEAIGIFEKNFINAQFYSASKQTTFTDPAERIELGKILFFDPILSGNGKRACASCHNPDKGFSENIPQSIGLDGKPLARNAPSLSYAALATSQFWDGHARSVEEQIAHVTTHPQEMGSQLETLPSRLMQSDEYVALFQKAFPQQEQPVNISNIEKSIGAYIRSLAVFDSPFDRFMRGETATIGKDIQQGFNLFMGKAKCGTCHFAPIFNGTVPPQYLDTEFEVIGVPDANDQLDNDAGRYGILPAQKYRHSFKTVTVRNAALTKPYMHNGRYKTLYEVVDFYNKGGGVGLGLDVPNQTLPFDKLNLTEAEMRAIVAFMESLTDVPAPEPPKKLPAFHEPSLSSRKIGGEY